MKTYRCPRCGRTVPSWQPVHIACVFARGKLLFFGLLFIPLVFFMGWNGDKLASTISGIKEDNYHLTATTFEFDPSRTAPSISPTNQTRVVDFSGDPLASPTQTPRIVVEPSKTRKPTSKISPSPTPTKRKTNTPRPTSTPTFDWSTCHADYVSRLKIGDKAYVSKDPPLANNVRQRPYTEATILGRIQPGEEVTIIDGPSCSNRWVWWKVRAKKNGLTGWTSEGDASAYWLIPIND